MKRNIAIALFVFALVGGCFAEVVVNATPTVVFIGGSADITAYVYDSIGMPVSDDTRVEFMSVIGFTDPPFSYTVYGVATTIIRYGCTTGTDTIIATTVDYGADTAFVRVIPGPPVLIEFIDPPDTVYCGDTDTICVQVFDSCGNPVGAGHEVTFAISRGDCVSPAATDDSGTACTIVTSLEPGSALLTVRSGDAVSYLPFIFVATGIYDSNSKIPERFTIETYPNPFNSSVNISVETGHDPSLQIEIFDINGRMVYEMPVGAHGRAPLPNGNTIWQPAEGLCSGVYLVRAKIGGISAIKRVVYLK